MSESEVAVEPLSAYLGPVEDEAINQKFNELIERLAYIDLDDNKRACLQKAYAVAFHAHQGQVRRSGEPYITHPLAVATVLAEMRMDIQSIIVALLHDVIEDTALTYDNIVELFSEEIATLIDGVTKLTRIRFLSETVAQAENLRKMLLAMSKDIRVVIVKLADRLHNMRTMGHMPGHRARVKARETLEIFAPIARRLGMHEVCLELEDLGFATLYPLRYQVLAKAVSRVQGGNGDILNEIKQIFSDKMMEAGVPYVAIEVREKHLYSIYKKIKKKRVSFSDITDVYAVRIITSSVDACYRSLGLIHSIFKPVPERFKDYIALPKMNGYQSLHTVLFGPYGVPIEVQIRTQSMHEMANNGISAHWLYKTREGQIRLEELQVHAWVKNLIDIQNQTGNSVEFMENVKIDLFPDEVFVFTPQGPIMQLPAGATVLDFAYAVHTDLGNSAVSAKINRQMAPLSTVLANGQTVEIVTDASARPLPSWLGCVTTAKAKSAIRHYLKNQRYRDAVELGERILKRSMESYNGSLDLMTDADKQKLADVFQRRDFDACLRDLALGHLAIDDFFTNMVALGTYAWPATMALPSGECVDAVRINGNEGDVIRYASCCYPLPGDPIQGWVTPGKGMMVHRQICSQVIDNKKTRPAMSVTWGDQVEGCFTSVMTITVANGRGALAKLALTCADQAIDIENVTMREAAKTDKWVTLDFEVHVENRHHLAQVIRALRRLPVVMKVVRRLTPAPA